MGEPIDWFVPLLHYVSDLVLVDSNKERKWQPEWEDEAAARASWESLVSHEGEPHRGDCTKEPQTCLQCLIVQLRQEAEYLYSIISKLVNEGYPESARQQQVGSEVGAPEQPEG